MEFPVQIIFKQWDWTPQMYVNDAAGAHLGYVHQRRMVPWTEITVFADDTRATPIYTVAADRAFVDRACYHAFDPAGMHLGTTKFGQRHSERRPHYLIHVGDEPAFELHAENLWIWAIDFLIGTVPLLGFLACSLLKPKYALYRTNGSLALRMRVQRLMFQSTFIVETHTDLSSAEQEAAMLGLMMIVMLEHRYR